MSGTRGANAASAGRITWIGRAALSLSDHDPASLTLGCEGSVQ